MPLTWQTKHVTMIAMSEKEVKRNRAIANSYRAGQTIRAIAILFSLSPARVHQLLRDAGIKLRPRGGDMRPKRNKVPA